MDSLERLNRTLITACHILDTAASQIRDAALSPTKEHIHKIGEPLVAIYEIQTAIYKLKPKLEPMYEEVSEETIAANRCLGETLISAYELADIGKAEEAILLLSEYEKNKPSEHHRGIVTAEKERLERNYGS